MSQGRRIAESSTALLIGNFANKISGFLIMLTVSRLLGADRFGLYTTVFAYVSIFGLVTDLGLTTVVIRKLSQDETAGRRWLGNALVFRWLLAITSYLICVGSAIVLYGSNERTWLIGVSALSFLLSPLSTHSAVFHSRLKLIGPTAVSLGSRLLLLLGVQWLARTGGTLSGLVALEVVQGAGANIVIWLLSRGLIRPVWTLERKVVLDLLRQGVPLFLTSAFVSLYFRVDVFFLDHYWNPAEIGNYAAAYRLAEAMPLIAAAVTNSIFPVLCQQIHNGNAAAERKLFRISLKMLLAVAGAIALVLWFYSQGVIATLYGTRFHEAAPLLAILGCNQILVFSNILMTTLLVARGQNRTFMYLTFGMLIWNVALNIAVIPRFGALGAAWTTLATELAGTIGCLVVTSTGRVFAKAAGRLLIPVGLCFGFFTFLAPRAAGFAAASLLLPAGIMLVYGATVFLTFFDADERAEFRNLQRSTTR